MRCTVCGSDFSIAHGGAYDIEHHIKLARHTSSAEDLKEKSKSVNAVNQRVFNSQVKYYQMYN